MMMHSLWNALEKELVFLLFPEIILSVSHMKFYLNYGETMFALRICFMQLDNITMIWKATMLHTYSIFTTSYPIIHNKSHEISNRFPFQLSFMLHPFLYEILNIYLNIGKDRMKIVDWFFIVLSVLFVQSLLTLFKIYFS